MTYIKEADDDIAYSLSNKSDGIEKKIITAEDFILEFFKVWTNNYNDYPRPVPLPDKIENFCLDISVRWYRKIVDEVAEEYIKNHKLYYAG